MNAPQETQQESCCQSKVKDTEVNHVKYSYRYNNFSFDQRRFSNPLINTTGKKVSTFLRVGDEKDAATLSRYTRKTCSAI